MNFEWDEAKSDSCLQDRGFDFAYVVRAFLDSNRVVHADQRHSYGEDRYLLKGKIDGRVFVVAYTIRRGAIRLISARKANSREVRGYENSANEA